jgi:hypothetical protein
VPRNAGAATIVPKRWQDGGPDCAILSALPVAGLRSMVAGVSWALWAVWFSVSHRERGAHAFTAWAGGTAKRMVTGSCGGPLTVCQRNGALVALWTGEILRERGV